MKSTNLKPAKPRAIAPVDEWIANRLGSDAEAEAPAAIENKPTPEPTKRLTIDIPRSLHMRLKLGATARDLNIADVIRDLIAREFPAP